MGTLERTTTLGSTGLVHYGRVAPQPAETKLRPLFANLVLVALFGGWIGFWVAVIWWLAR